MKILLLGIALMTSCGTEDIDNTEYSPDQSALETEEPDVLTIMMCQQATACNSEGECIDVERPLEFTLDSDLIYWQACYNFEPCDGKALYTEQQIQNYRSSVCGE
jgi:hypothetical protein